jgi:aromatic ring-opening dioxygenase catalytic subunit (LigB family)
MFAPDARIAHPREDHLIPLMVALGAAEEEPAALVYHQGDFLGGWALSSFRFGDPVPAVAQTKLA